MLRRCDRIQPIAAARRARAALPALALACVAVLAGCGGSSTASSSTAAAATTTATTPPAAAQPGLGSTRASFEAAHAPHEAIVQERKYGLVTSNASGHITGYEVDFGKPLTDPERLNLVGGISLPAGAIVVAETPICKLWRSTELRHSTGFEFARATTVPGTSAAHIEATSNPSC